jgi:hypothetical protein
MKCCENGKKQRTKRILYEGMFSFEILLTYCDGCGIVIPSNTLILDGKLRDEFRQ